MKIKINTVQNSETNHRQTLVPQQKWHPDGQIEMNLTFEKRPLSVLCPGSSYPVRGRRRRRAAIWFNYMRQVVSQARDWLPTPNQPSDPPPSN